jgi:hypothetical protein
MCHRASRYGNVLAFVAAIVTFMLLSGCIVSVSGEGGSSHHVIIGFGIVSVNEDPDKAVVATDVYALGLSLSDRPGLKVGLGYSSGTVVSVAPDAEDVRVEISKKPWGPLIVDTQKAILKQVGEGAHNHDAR